MTYLGASSAGYILNKFTDIFGTFVRLIVNLFGCFIIWLGLFFLVSKIDSQKEKGEIDSDLVDAL